MEGASNKQFAQGSLSDHPQQSLSGSHTLEVHIQGRNIELENEVHRPEVMGRKVPVQRD